MTGRSSGRAAILLAAHAAIFEAGCGHWHNSRCRGPEECPHLPAASVTPAQWRLDAAPTAVEARTIAKARLSDRSVGQAIDAEFCARRASEVCAAAALANSESNVGNRPLESLTGPAAKKKARMEKTLLEHAAWEARTKQVAAALETLYRLAEVQAKAQLLLQCLDDVETAFEDANQIRDKGFTTDLEPLRSRRDEIWHAAQKLEAAQVGLDARLRTLLKLNCTPCDARLIAVVDWSLGQRPAAECLAEQHPELKFLDNLESAVDVDTLPVVRRYLNSINPLLGAAAAIPGLNLFQQIVLRWIPLPSVRREIDLRRRQIADYRVDRAGQLQAEAIARAAEHESIGLRLGLDREAHAAATQRARQAAHRHRDGAASRIELALARLGEVDLEQRIVGLLADGRVAEVKLRQALGQLVEPPEAPLTKRRHVGRAVRGILSDQADCPNGPKSDRVEVVNETR